MTGLITILTDPQSVVKAKEFERGLTFDKIIQSGQPICEVRKQTGFKAIAQALDIQLTKLVANLNLKWNLTDSQIGVIVEDLLYKYPNETIDDFVLLFRKIRHGEFGDLMRLDSAILFNCMEKYLEEKYAVIELKLMAEKENFYKPIIPEKTDSDWLAKWKAEIDAIQIKKPAPLSEEDIEKEGQEKPVKKIHPFTPKEQLDRHDLHIQYCRENYDPLTGKPKPNWISEDEWLAQQPKIKKQKQNK